MPNYKRIIENEKRKKGKKLYKNMTFLFLATQWNKWSVHFTLTKYLEMEKLNIRSNIKLTKKPKLSAAVEESVNINNQNSAFNGSTATRDKALGMTWS